MKTSLTQEFLLARKRGMILFEIDLAEKYAEKAQEREKHSRQGFILCDDGKKIPFASELVQFASIRRWKKLRKERQEEIKQLKKQLEELKLEGMVG